VSEEVSTLPAKAYRSDSAQFVRMRQIALNMKPMTTDQVAAWQKKHGSR